MKILTLDIETAPTTAYVWGMWEQNVAMNQIVKPGYILSFAAKWVGEEEIIFSSLRKDGKKRMLVKAASLLNEADVIITYNGKKFDIKTLNREFVLENILPPARYKHIDLLQVVKQNFKFPHNKLDYVAQALGLGGKLKHAGFEMWIGCMADKQESWDMLEAYNVEDVAITERVYAALRPWILNHPNVALYDELQHVCPVCGGIHLQRRGFAYTGVGKYQRYQCNTCGSWSRNKINEAIKGIMANA